MHVMAVTIHVCGVGIDLTCMMSLKWGMPALHEVHTSLHEKGVSAVQFPCLMLAAEVGALLQDGLHLAVMLHVPVDACLSHQHCAPC